MDGDQWRRWALCQLRLTYVDANPDYMGYQMTNLRKLLFGIAVLPFLGALAYGSYQGIVTAGQNAANPLYDVPIVTRE